MAASTPKPTSAAVFDLDRTLLSGASGPIISESLRRVGLLSGSTSGLESIAFGIFNLIGETWPSMFLSRQGARAARGWSVDKVSEAAQIAAEPLAELILPYASRLIEEHRADGRRLVMATTTPADLITPLADALGFDDVIATRYGRHDGRYDGTIDGEFVWGKGKARSVAEWAGREGIDLDESYAYSDSYYDIPMLSIVGHPHAVNPDPRMAGIAALRRWPIVHFDVPSGVPKLAGVEPQKLLFLLAQPQLFPWTRFELSGLSNLPDEGPAIVVANHRSYFDPFAIGYLMSKHGRPVRFLGKKEVFDAPIVGDVVKALGGIRVDRGTGSDEPLHAAEEALAAGEIVALMPQGTIPRGPAFFDPDLSGRWGAVKLHRATGAPIVPIGLWGTEKVWPRSAKAPDITNVLNPPTIRIQVGHAVEFPGDAVDRAESPDAGLDPASLDPASLDADTEAMMRAIEALLPPESREVFEPTEDELRLTYPGGVIPEDVDTAASHESGRRPGAD